MVETLRVCAVLGVISRTSQTQHKATGGVGGGGGSEYRDTQVGTQVRQTQARAERLGGHGNVKRVLHRGHCSETESWSIRLMPSLG